MKNLNSQRIKDLRKDIELKLGFEPRLFGLQSPCSFHYVTLKPINKTREYPQIKEDKELNMPSYNNEGHLTEVL